MCNYHHTIFLCGCTRHTRTTKCELERYRDVAIARSADSFDPSERKAFVDLQSLAEKLRPSYRLHGYEEVYHAKDTLCDECEERDRKEGVERRIQDGELVKWRKRGPTRGLKAGYEENYNKDGSLKHEIKRNVSVDMLRPKSRAEQLQTRRSTSHPSKKDCPLVEQKKLHQPCGDAAMADPAPKPKRESEGTEGTVSMTESALKAVKKVRFGFMEVPDKPKNSEFRRTPKK